MAKTTTILFLLLVCPVCIIAQKPAGKAKPRQADIRKESVFKTTVPDHLFDVVLARPTSSSITLSLLFYQNREVLVEFWNADEKNKATLDVSCVANEPKSILLDNLIPDEAYFYSLKETSGELLTAEPCRFHTQRSNSSAFTFTVCADSHLDENTDTETYLQTLLNAASDSADFHIDLGDTFMTDKYQNNYKNALSQYVAQRFYFGQLCRSSSLFLVQGNHDGESGQHLNENESSMTIWANQTRKIYFPNPVPDHFYTGNNDEDTFCGKIQNYYAFEWGNALFVVLDPFWYTPLSGSDNPWDRTLGKAQYDWLTNTLNKSKAGFKFVFIHNLVGGADIKGKSRGGAEVAELFEWGGKNPDGTEGFSSHRPDWEMPVHQILVNNKVTAVFHGHDHVFAKQDLDGIVYQCLSQPGAKESGNIRNATEYGYRNGTILNNPGYMRVAITSDSASFEFVKTNILDNTLNNPILFQYTLYPKPEKNNKIRDN